MSVKFRFWDKKEKLYIDWESALNDRSKTLADWFCDNNIKAERYTEFRLDKEVYDGDIVRAEYKGEAFSGLVGFEGGCHGKFVIHGNDDWYTLSCARDVIGNIHENPELLENIK